MGIEAKDSIICYVQDPCIRNNLKKIAENCGYSFNGKDEIDSSISDIISHKPSYVVYDLKDIQGNLFQIIFNLNTYFKKIKILIFNTGLSKNYFEWISSKIESDSVIFIHNDGYSDDYLNTILKNRKMSNKKNQQILEKLNQMKSSYIENIFEKSLRNIAKLKSIKQSLNIKSELRYEINRNWHSISGTLRVFSLEKYEAKIFELESFSSDMNEHIKEIDVMLDTQIGEAIKFVEQLYREKQALLGPKSDIH